MITSAKMSLSRMVWLFAFFQKMGWFEGKLSQHWVARVTEISERKPGYDHFVYFGKTFLITSAFSQYHRKLLAA